MMNQISQLLNQYQESARALREHLRQDGKRKLEEYLTEVFATHEGFNKAAIIGYTPSFNDGEPCEHSQEVYTGAVKRGIYTWRNNSPYISVDFSEREDEGLTAFFVGEDEELPDDEDLVAMEAIVAKLPNLTCETIEEVEGILNGLEDVFRQVFETNFILKIEKGENGNVTIDVEEYDCGY